MEALPCVFLNTRERGIIFLKCPEALWTLLTIADGPVQLTVRGENPDLGVSISSKPEEPLTQGSAVRLLSPQCLWGGSAFEVHTAFPGQSQHEEDAPGSAGLTVAVCLCSPAKHLCPHLHHHRLFPALPCAVAPVDLCGKCQL